MIYGPKADRTYVVEFMTAEGDVLAISIPSVRVRRRHVAASGDLLEAPLPEGIHNANARPVSGDQDGVSTSNEPLALPIAQIEFGDRHGFRRLFARGLDNPPG